MKSIPLYDATAPIVCIADDDEIPERIDQVERMRDALDHVDRTEHGLLLRFPNEPAVEADVRRFAADEKRCCQFWGFEVLDDDDLSDAARDLGNPDVYEVRLDGTTVNLTQSVAWEEWFSIGRRP